MTEQIQSLIERQEKLLEQKAELQNLLDAFCDAREEDVKVGKSEDTVEETEEHWKQSFSWEKEANDVLLNIFGLRSFRANQREVRCFHYISKLRESFWILNLKINFVR
jgi:ATP-dependent DNA helicase Q1